MNDPYTYNDQCVQRLMEIYREHKSLVVAVDFDDTVYDTHKKHFMFPRVVKALKKCNELELDIVMFTASVKSRFIFIENHMNDTLGIKIQGINKNVIPDFPYGHDGKIFYNIMLDDRAGLGQSIEILEEVIFQIEG